MFKVNRKNNSNNNKNNNHKRWQNNNVFLFSNDKQCISGAAAEITIPECCYDDDEYWY